MDFKYGSTVTFRDIINAGLITGGPKIAKGKYRKDENNNITGNMPVINAIDIDWCNANVAGLDDAITSTGQLLELIGKMKAALGNIDASNKPDILSRLTSLEASAGQGGSIPSDLTNQLTTINNKLNALTERLNNMTGDTIKHEIMEKSTYDGLTSYDPNTLYFIIGEPDYIIVNGGGSGGSDDEPTRIDLDSITSQLTVNGVIHRESNVVLEPGLTYIISGTLEGTITIDASNYTAAQMDLLGNTEIILSNVIIVSDNNTYGILYKTPADNKGFKDLVVTVTKNTVNIIACRKVEARTDNQWGALHSMNNLLIRGTGYLSLRNDGGHGIRATEVDIAGPHIYCSVEHDGVHGKKLFWNYGSLYLNKGNDALGTGDNGRILVFDGTFNIVNIDGELFDSALAGLYNSKIDINITNGSQPRYANMSPINPSNFASAFSVRNPGPVYQYRTKSDYLNGNGEQVDITNNVYKINGDVYTCISVVGVISNAIEINTSNSTDGADVTIYLNNAYITNNRNIPTIYYTGEKGKIKVFAVQDSCNIIENTYELETFGAPSNYESDAIKSENNGTLELKNGSHTYVTSISADGIDTGTMKINDSKGSLIVTRCGQRGLKGNVILIGPDAEIVESVIRSYYDDPDDANNYKTFDGNCIVKNNCTKVEPGAHIIGNNVKNTGFADIYARNGKATKGVFATKNSELNGIIICGTIGAVVSIDMDNASNMNFNSIVTPNVTQTKIVDISNENNLAYNIYKEPIN